MGQRPQSGMGGDDRAKFTVIFGHEKPSAVEWQSTIDPIGHKDRKNDFGFGRNRLRAYRRHAG
jgi:hypothetical protein